MCGREGAGAIACGRHAWARFWLLSYSVVHYLQRSSRWIIGSYALSSLPTNAFFLNEFPDLMQIEL